MLCGSFGVGRTVHNRVDSRGRQLQHTVPPTIVGLIHMTLIFVQADDSRVPHTGEVRKLVGVHRDKNNPPDT
jgi:hypothetical protein